MGVISRLLIASPEHRLMETHYVHQFYISVSGTLSCQNLTNAQLTVKIILAFIQML